MVLSPPRTQALQTVVKAGKSSKHPNQPQNKVNSNNWTPQKHVSLFLKSVSLFWSTEPNEDFYSWQNDWSTWIMYQNTKSGIKLVTFITGLLKLVISCYFPILVLLTSKTLHTILFNNRSISWLNTTICKTFFHFHPSGSFFWHIQSSLSVALEQ